MGTAQRELIRLLTVGKQGELAMNQLEHTGLVRTDPDDPSQMVTDSAAAATAFSTGVKSYNGAIATGPDRLPRTTLLELAKASGKATGLVTTSQVTDASPAAFGSHVLDRNEQSEIARQYIEVAQPDVILGGGEDFWLPAGSPGAYPDRPPTDTSERSQGNRGDLIARAQQLGYSYVSSRDGLAASTGSKLLGLFANQEMFEHRREGQGDIYDPVVPLKEMMAKALDVVSQDPDGFFLFVEEEGIDEMAHLNNTPLTVKSGKALDDTVAAAVAFQRTHPNTLILVVGDHATGGLAIENVDGADETGSGQSVEDTPFTVPGTTQRISVDWTTNQHTGDSTPVTASGPGSELFAGFIDNTDIFHGIKQAARLGSPSEPVCGPRRRRRDRAGDARAVTRELHDPGPVRPRSRTGLPRNLDRDRDVERRRRTAHRERSEPERDRAPRQRRLRARPAASGSRRERGVRPARRGRPAARVARIRRARVQRPAGARVQAADRGERAAADRRLREDAGLHAVDGVPVRTRSSALTAAR